MIAVYSNDHETIVVGLNADDSPMDSDGTLFGPDSGRDIEEFERFNVDTDKGQTAHILQTVGVRVRGGTGSILTQEQRNTFMHSIV